MAALKNSRRDKTAPLTVPHIIFRSLSGFRLLITSLIYFFNFGAYRVSTSLIEQISRRFQEGSRTCLPCFGLLCNVPM